MHTSLIRWISSFWMERRRLRRLTALRRECLSTCNSCNSLSTCNSPRITPTSDECFCSTCSNSPIITLQYIATDCSTLQHTAARCYTLQHAATNCIMMQNATTHGNKL